VGDLLAREEVLADPHRRRRVVQRVEVDSRGAVAEELFRLLDRDLDGELELRVGIVAVALHALADPDGEVGAAFLGESRDLIVRPDGHQAHDDGDVDPAAADLFDELEVAGVVEEVLGHGGVGARLHLAHEVVDVFAEAGRFRMALRIARDENVESSSFLDERNELGGESEPALGYGNIGRRLLSQERDVPPERQDAGEAGVEVALQVALDLLPGEAEAGEVGDDVDLHHLLHGEAGLERADVTAPAGAEGHGNEVGIELRQVGGRFLELFPPRRGLGREELEAHVRRMPGQTLGGGKTHESLAPHSRHTGGDRNGLRGFAQSGARR